MKRIAVFVPGGLDAFNNGVHIPSLYQLIERLSTRFQIIAYSLRNRRDLPSANRCGDATVKYLHCTNAASWPAKVWAFRSAFVNDHSGNPFDAIHARLGLPAELAAVLLGKYFRVPSCITFVGSETANLANEQYGNLRTEPARGVTHWIAREADALVLLTRYQLTQLDRTRLAHAHISIIPEGADTSRFVPLHRPLSAIVNFLSVGNIHPLKDHETLLQTFALILKKMPARLRIIGEDQRQSKMLALARLLGIESQVEFLGYIPPDSLPNHYRWANVFLHTSLYEGQSVAVAEAAAAGLLVAGTNVGLLHDLGEDKVILSAPRDPAGLAASVIRALREPIRCANLRRLSTAWASEYNLDWTVRQYEMLLSSLQSPLRTK